MKTYHPTYVTILIIMTIAHICYIILACKKQEEP